MRTVKEQRGISYAKAIEDFRRAREKAALETILRRLRGEPVDLLSFEDVRVKLHGQMTSPRGLEEIPLDAIVGSVGRYSDFTRSFLPRDRSDAQRWALVKAMTEGLAGLPPIEVYKVGEVYFVRDGHHRVSVAREVGAAAIEGYVTELRTRVPLTAEDDPSDLIIKAEYADFLEKTGLDRQHPDIHIEVTEPGKYPILEQHIAVHRHLMAEEGGREVSYGEAVEDWYQRVYWPVVHAIRQQGILREFPDRTETDLYLWIANHRAELREMLGWEVAPEQAAADLAEQYSRRPGRVAGRVGGRLLEAMVPDDLEGGPPPGQWRREVVATRADDRLFPDILVPIREDESGWQALEQGIEIAEREGSRLLGLHVVATEEEAGAGPPAGIVERFEARCAGAGVEGMLSIEGGEVAPLICSRSRWTDLVILSLAHPPAERPMARLGSGLRKLIRRCPRPLLTVPVEASPIERPMIAYDGSPKAQEALFIATYMASAWSLPLTVLSVDEGDGEAARWLERARGYLEGRGVSASYALAVGGVVESVLSRAEREGVDLLLMGGYGASPMIEAVLGSSVDEILRRSWIPSLICR